MGLHLLWSDLIISLILLFISFHSFAFHSFHSYSFIHSIWFAGWDGLCSLFLTVQGLFKQGHIGCLLRHLAVAA